MAKQAGKIKIEGRRIGRLVFYKMGKEYYVRTKSSLNGKRVKKDPKFHRTMLSAGRLACASKIASKVYKALPASHKLFDLYRLFTGEAIAMLKEGMSEEEILQKLMDVYVPKVESSKEEVGTKKEIVDKENTSNSGQKYTVRRFMSTRRVGFHRSRLLHFDLKITNHRNSKNAEVPHVINSKESNTQSSRIHGLNLTCPWEPTVHNAKT